MTKRKKSKENFYKYDYFMYPLLILSSSPLCTSPSYLDPTISTPNYYSMVSYVIRGGIESFNISLSSALVFPSISSS